MTPRQVADLGAAVAVAGAVGMVAGALFAPAELARAHLVALMFAVGISGGALVLLMIHHLTRGTWSTAILRPLEAAVKPLPLIAILFAVYAPFALGLDELYPWAHHGGDGHHDLGAKARFLSPAWFWLRTVVYFALWIGLAQLMLRRRRKFAAPGLVVFGISASFAAIDWVMSLDPAWISSIYTLHFLVDHMLSGLAFALIALAVTGTDASAETLRRLGTLLLAFVLLWAYMSYSQYLLVWSADLPTEVGWYAVRTGPGWKWLALALVVLHLAVPFVVLAFRRTKERARVLYAIAALLLAMRVVDLEWLITPFLAPDGIHVHWTDLAALLGVGGAWTAIAFRSLDRTNPTTEATSG